MSNSLTLVNPYVLLDGVDVTAYVKQLTLKGIQLMADDTSGSGVTAKEYSPTIKDADLSMIFQFVLGAGATEETLWSIYNGGTAVDFIVGAAGSSGGTATPNWSGSCIIREAPFVDGDVGELVSLPVGFQPTGAISRNVS